MTFQQLQYILQIAKSQSIAAAAKNLFVSSSSVSIALRSLEKELGYPLFTRTPLGLIPTDQGRLVLNYAEQICHIHTQLNAVGCRSARTIRISCSDQPPLAAAFAQLLKENRDREDLQIINVPYQSGEESYRQLASRELDLCISTVLSFFLGYWEPLLRKNGARRQILKTVPAVIQVGPGHRLYHADKVSPYDLRNDAFIDNPQRPLSQNSIFKSNLCLDPSRVLFISKTGIRKQALMEGLGFTIDILPPKDTPTQLRSIPLEGAFFHFSAVTNAQVPLQPEALRFLQLVRQNLDLAYPDQP